MKQFILVRFFFKTEINCFPEHFPLLHGHLLVGEDTKFDTIEKQPFEFTFSEKYFS